MADRKVHFLATLVFDENSDIRKQVDTELVFRNRLAEDLQCLIVGREIKHFVIADDEAINKKLVEERKQGKWICGEPCPCCGENRFKGLDADIYADWKPNFCPNCGADMRGNENG